MFEVGFWEIVLIFIILLVVVGPERLPGLARTAGLWIGKARSMVASVKAEIERELSVEELRRSVMEQTDSDEFKKLADQVKAINSDLRSAGEDLRTSIDQSATQVAETVHAVAAEGAGNTAAADEAKVPEATPLATADSLLSSASASESAPAKEHDQRQHPAEVATSPRPGSAATPADAATRTDSRIG